MSYNSVWNKLVKFLNSAVIVISPKVMVILVLSDIFVFYRPGWNYGNEGTRTKRIIF